MAQIVNKSYFNKQNSLYIPLSVDAPLPSAVTSTPNNSMYIDNLCVEVEKTILVNALGLSTYNELQLAIDDLFVNPLYAKYQKLVNGEEYDGKIWKGLSYDLSLIAQVVFIEYLSEKSTNLSSVGNSKIDIEKGSLATPMYKIANASSSFIRQYQGGVIFAPIVRGNFIDWKGEDNNVEVSLYRYLTDKKIDFPNMDIAKFAFYEQLNSFGI